MLLINPSRSPVEPGHRRELGLLMCKPLFVSKSLGFPCVVEWHVVNSREEVVGGEEIDTWATEPVEDCDRSVGSRICLSRHWTLLGQSVPDFVQIMTNPQPGALILGGYNKGRLGSPCTNFTMDYPITPPGGDRECPIQVTIASLIYQSPSRGDTTLLGNGQQITACIEPYVCLSVPALLRSC